MSCVRFRFKSSLDYDKVTFDGLQLSVAELREKIMAQKKLGLATDFSLELMDPLSRKVYNDDNEMIPRNASVVVRRVPKLMGNQRLPKTNNRDPTIPNADAGSSTLSVDQLKKTANLSTANASEEDKVLAMMSQAGADFNPATYAKHKPRGGGAVGGMMSTMPGLMRPPPPNYVCHRCGQKGHWIKYCPTNGDPTFDNRRIQLKRSAGIPTNQTALASSDMPGAMLDRHGNVVIRTVDLNAVKDKTSKMGPSGISLEEESVPPELICSICNEVVKEAVIIPCCGESFCADCIQDHLLENDFTCFACKQADVSPDTLVPNKKQRAAAKSFLNRMAEKKSISVARGLPASALALSSLSEPKKFMLSNKGTPSFSSFSFPSMLATSSSASSSSSSTTYSTTTTAPTAATAATSSSPPSSSSSSSASFSSASSSSSSSTTTTTTTTSTSTSSPSSPPKVESPVTTSGNSKKDEEEEDKSSQDVGVASDAAIISTPITITDERNRKPSPKRNMTSEPISLTNHPKSLPTAGTSFSSRHHSTAASSMLLPPPMPLPLPLPNPPILHPLQPQLPLGQGALSTGPLNVLPPHLPHLPPMHVHPPPPPPPANPDLDVASMARLTELLAAAQRSSHDHSGRSGRSSPPPLSLEEFYHQQSLLRRRRHSYSRTPSCSSYSGSITPDSRRSSRSYSYSRSWSRSPSRSRSRSRSRTRSRSRSPARHSNHSHGKHRAREREVTRSPRPANGHEERHKRKRARDSENKERSKRSKTHHHRSLDKETEGDTMETASGDVTSEADQKPVATLSTSHHHRSKRKHRRHREHRHAVATQSDAVEVPNNEPAVSVPSENGVESEHEVFVPSEEIKSEKKEQNVTEDEVLDVEKVHEKKTKTIAAVKSTKHAIPDKSVSHHKVRHSKERKPGKKRERALLSSVVGLVAKSSSDEAKVSTSSSSSSAHKKHRHHSHKEKRKHKQKHKSSLHKK